MKKFYSLTKTLLVAVCLFVGASNVWAENVAGTLVHTASSFCSTSNASFTSTVDAEKEHINNSNFNNTWAGAAYADFSFVIPSGHSVTKAELTFTVYGSGKVRTADLSYVAAGTQLDYATMSGGTAKVNLSSTNIATGLNFPINSDQEHTVDVTSAVQAIIAAEQTNIIFKLTNNPGGGDLYGKGSAAAKQPTLVITTSAETLYTASFTEDNSLNPTVTIYSDAGRTTPVSNGTLTNGTTYYFRATLTGYRNYDGSFTVSSADPDVHFTMTAKEIYNYTVNAIDAGSNVLYKIADGSVYENENVTVAYDAFYLKNDGNLLQANRLSTDGKEYRYTFNVDANNKVATVTYNNTSYSNVVFYKEAEDVATLTEVSSGNVPIRCSGAKAAYAESDAVITTLGPGKYRLSSFAWGNAGTELKVNAGEAEIATFTTAASTLAIVTSNEFTLTTSTDIIVKAGGNAGNSPKVLDYFFIQKTGEVATIGSYEYASFSSTYPVNVDVEGLEAYIATSSNGTSVTMEKVTGNVAAGTGLVITGAAGSYTLPVVASGSWYNTTTDPKNYLFAVNSDYNLAAAGEGGTNYVLSVQSEKVVWAPIGATEAPVKAGQAALWLPASNNSARALRMSFGGITGVENVEAAAEVAKKNGAYLENGKIAIYKNGMKFNAAGAQMK